MLLLNSKNQLTVITSLYSELRHLSHDKDFCGSEL